MLETENNIGITALNNTKVAVCGPSIVIYPLNRPKEPLTAVLSQDQARILIRTLMGEHKLNPYDL
jgi:hypothetical protein